MGFGKEIKDFVNTALAVHKSFRDDSATSARNNYYQALISNSDRNAKLAERRLNITEQSRRDSLSERAANHQENQQIRRDSNARQDQSRQDANDRFQKTYDQRERLLKSKTLDPDDYPGGAHDSSAAPAAPSTTAPSAPNATAPGPVSSAVDNDEEETAAAPMTGAAQAPNLDPYGTDQATDEGDDNVQAYAQGGAVDDYASSGDTAPQQAQAAKGGATSAKSGFDIKQALDSWEGGFPPVQDLETSSSAPPAQAVDDPATHPAPAPVPQQAPPQAVDDGASKAPAKPDNPVGLGLKSMMDAYDMKPQQGAVDDGNPQGNPKLKDFHAGANAASDAEVKAMDKAVDPDNELSESTKTVARLDAGVKYWLAKSNPKNAAVLSQRLLEYGKQKTQTLGTAAAAALKKGDTQQAVDLLKKAYDYIPDGGELKASLTKDGHVQASVFDQRTGTEMNLGELGPQELFHYATGAANGSTYMNHLVAVASGHIGVKQPAGAGGGDKLPKIQDRLNVATTMKNEASSGANGDTATAGDAPKYNVPKGYEDSVQSIASDVFSSNNVSQQDAMRLASHLVDPAQTANRLTLTRDGAVYKADDGRQFKVPQNAYLQAAAIRGRLSRDKATADAATKAKADRDTQDQKRIAVAQQPIMQRTADQQSRYMAAKRGYATGAVEE